MPGNEETKKIQKKKKLKSLTKSDPNRIEFDQFIIESQNVKYKNKN